MPSLAPPVAPEPDPYTGSSLSHPRRRIRSSLAARTQNTRNSSRIHSIPTASPPASSTPPGRVATSAPPSPSSTSGRKKSLDSLNLKYATIHFSPRPPNRPLTPHTISQITQHHSALLLQAASVGSLEGDLAEVRHGLLEVEGSVTRSAPSPSSPHTPHSSLLESRQTATQNHYPSFRFVDLPHSPHPSPARIVPHSTCLSLHCTRPTIARSNGGGRLKGSRIEFTLFHLQWRDAGLSSR